MCCLLPVVAPALYARSHKAAADHWAAFAPALVMLRGDRQQPETHPPLPPAPAPQGSTWAVRRRCYWTHDARPPTLSAEVRPADVPYLRPAARYAAWSDKQQARGFGTRVQLAELPLSGGAASVAVCLHSPHCSSLLLAAGPLPTHHPTAQELRLLSAVGESWRLAVRGGGGHDLLTLSPVLQAADSTGGSCVAAAPIGLVNLLNCGGAVLAAELQGEQLRVSRWQAEGAMHTPLTQAPCAFRLPALTACLPALRRGG